MNEIKQAIDDMNALPNIDGEDSPRLQEFVRVTTREVELVGGASAGTTLEMIGYIRELEHAAIGMREACVAKVRELAGDYKTLSLSEWFSKYEDERWENVVIPALESITLEAAANSAPKDNDA